MMVPDPVESPTCPSCHAALVLGGTDAPFWACPNGHGVACTVTAAYGHVQEDEITRIWHGSEKASAGSRACPMCGKPMVEVTTGVDADEIAEGDPGDKADTASVTIDVCRDDEVFWLDAGEMQELPADKPAPPPSAQELANLETVRKTMDAELDEGLRREMNSGLLNHFANAFSRHYPAFTGMLERAQGVNPAPAESAPPATAPAPDVPGDQPA